MPAKSYAIIAGVGPGTGAAIAKRFAKAYSVVLLSRSTNSFSALEKEINDSGGHAVGVATDVADENGVADALRVVDEKLGADAVCAVSPSPPFFNYRFPSPPRPSPPALLLYGLGEWIVSCLTCILFLI